MRGFITGLPRSRTKWFAEYFDGIPGITGYHEPLNGMKTKQDFYNLVDNGCIISDSGLFITDFQDRYDLPTVIIERDIDDVYESLKVYFDDQGYPEPSYAFLQQQQAAVDKLSGLRVAYDDIDASMESIHAHLGIPYSPEYAERMALSNLQIPVLITDVGSYELWL
jgi:hypothetical protein